MKAVYWRATLRRYTLVSQILGDSLDYTSVSVLSWVVIRLHRFGFGVWRPLAITNGVVRLTLWPVNA